MANTKAGGGIWRTAFAISGVLILIGGPRHPRGTMVEMLAHPDWVWSHTLLLLAFVGLLIGLVAIRLPADASTAVRRWHRFAIVGTALQAIEMFLHTVSVVDQQNLANNLSTPVLSTHLALAVAFYPVFATTLIGFIITAARDRIIGSMWIAWLGVLGAAGHGLSAPLVVGLDQPWAGILFPTMILIGVWAVVAALWPMPARTVTA